MTSAPPSAVRYREAGRTYLTTAVLFSLIAAGFVIDLVVGAGIHHVIGWAIAMVLVVGAEALTVYAARVMRTITITDDAVAVGEDTVPRSAVVTASPAGESDDRVLGRRYATGLPRGTHGVCLELADGERVIVATRHPERVLTTLGAEPDVQVAEIRIAEPDDLALLAEIDERSESLFRVAGLELPVFELPPDHPETKRVLVVGRPAFGFVELAEVDGQGYLAEVAVLPSHMRRGHGAALVRAACDWTREQGYPAITLTTYADVAWNGPFYRSLGFVEVAEPSPGLVRIRAHEAEVGLDAVGPRIVMRCEV